MGWGFGVRDGDLGIWGFGVRDLGFEDRDQDLRFVISGQGWGQGFGIWRFEFWDLGIWDLRFGDIGMGIWDLGTGI